MAARGVQPALSSRPIRARARTPPPFFPAPAIGAGAHVARPRPAHTAPPRPAPPRPRFPAPPRLPQRPTATWGSAEIRQTTTPSLLIPGPRSPGLSSGGRHPKWRSGSPLSGLRRRRSGRRCLQSLLALPPVTYFLKGFRGSAENSGIFPNTTLSPTSDHFVGRKKQKKIMYTFFKLAAWFPVYLL